MTTANPFADDVVHLRHWGTDEVFALPPPMESSCYVGSAGGCSVRLSDIHVAPRHAKITRIDNAWSVASLAGATALRADGRWCKEVFLSPGTEIGIGGATLVAESRQWIMLRAFCARLLGWRHDRGLAIDHALRAIRLAAARRAPLVLAGEGDLVPIAHTLHRRVLGIDVPFIVCDRRRRAVSESTRAPANEANASAAYAAATGGTLCVRARRLPSELPAMLKRLYEPDSRVQLVVCLDSTICGSTALVTMPPPVEVPPLTLRESELPRIVDEYGSEAIAAMGAPETCFSDHDRRWVIDRAATTLTEVEKATARLVALNASGSITGAAALLGMAQVSLSRWLHRRGGPPCSGMTLPSEDPRRTNPATFMGGAQQAHAPAARAQTINDPGVGCAADDALSTEPQVRPG